MTKRRSARPKVADATYSADAVAPQDVVASPVPAAPADAAGAPLAATPAVLTFLPDGQERRLGELLRGGTLVLRYAPARFAAHQPAFAGGTEAATTEREIVAYARFLPGGQVHGATLVGTPAETSAEADVAVPLASAEISIPPDATTVELWFRSTDAAGTESWDSRFGQNYRYDIA
jgi:hypothetical protein